MRRPLWRRPSHPASVLATCLAATSRGHGARGDWTAECPLDEIRGVISTQLQLAQQAGRREEAARWEAVLGDDRHLFGMCCHGGWSGDGSGGPGPDGGPNENGLCWPGGVGDFRRYARCCHGELRALAQGPVPSWMRSEIASDLQPWGRARIEGAALDAMEQDWGHVYCRFRIEGGQLRTCGAEHVQRVIGIGPSSEMWGQFVAMAQAVRTLLANDLLPDGLDFFVSPHPYDYVAMPVPIFTKARFAFVEGPLRVPSYELVGPWIDRQRRAQLEMRVPWEEKEAKVFWRGGLRSFNSCPCNSRAAWPLLWRHANLSSLLAPPEASQPPPGACDDLPPQVCGEARRTPACRCSRQTTNSTSFRWSNRLRLCQLSKEHPDLVDAKLTYVPEGYRDIAQRIEESGYTAGYAAFADQHRFRYLISTDGSTIDDTRVYWMLSSGSLVFKQITPLLPYGLPGMRPWVHFVPVREDLADLLDKVGWAQRNDDACRAMAERARSFASEYFTQAQILHYMQRLLIEYAGIQGVSTKEKVTQGCGGGLEGESVRDGPPPN